jgi:hypothetical protein
MLRILLLIVLGWLLFKFIKRLANTADASKSAKKLEGKMLQCPRCGCHVPISETLQKNNQVVCNNPECRA